MTAMDVDENGFLLDFNEWTPQWCQQVAEAEGITLTDTHRSVIECMREFFRTYGHSPNNRAMVNFAGKTLGGELASSATHMRLFGERPARTAAKLAGMPKPAHCH